jgi:hypothetical protein
MSERLGWLSGVCFVLLLELVLDHGVFVGGCGMEELKTENWELKIGK